MCLCELYISKHVERETKDSKYVERATKDSKYVERETKDSIAKADVNIIGES